MLDDGYVRLTYPQLQVAPLVHLVSGLDEDRPDESGEGATPTAITGYTEWVSSVAPELTIGWDWQMLASVHCVHLRRESDPRSNVMLQDACAVDEGPLRTALLLGILVDDLDWKAQTLEYINARYQAQPGSAPHPPYPNED